MVGGHPGLHELHAGALVLDERVSEKGDIRVFPGNTSAWTTTRRYNTRLCRRLYGDARGSVILARASSGETATGCGDATWAETAHGSSLVASLRDMTTTSVRLISWAGLKYIYLFNYQAPPAPEPAAAPGITGRAW